MELTTDGRVNSIILSSSFRWVALTTFLVGLIIDTASTTTLIGHPEFVEANPLVDFAIAVGGPLGMIAFKLGLPGVVLIAFSHRHDGDELTWFVNMLLVTCGGLWTLAGIWNLLLLV